GRCLPLAGLRLAAHRGAGARGGVLPGIARDVDRHVAAETHRGVGAPAGGMATFALLAWVAWRISIREQPESRATRLFAAAVGGVVLLACQIFLGGWTSSNYAALACGIGGSAFPTCLGQWWPAMDFHQGFILWRGIGVDFQGGILDAAARTAIQMVHRFG